MKNEIGIIGRSFSIFGTIFLLCTSASTWANTDEESLIAASGNGDLSRVKTLLVTKVNVNAHAPDGVTALIAASQNGYEEVVQVLLQAKADVNAKTSNGTTALMQASQKGHRQGAGADCRQG